MRDAKVDDKVRTNDLWRKFFKTKEIVRGTVTGFWYDHKTVWIMLPDGDEQRFHQDWLEPDVKKEQKELI